MKKIFYLFFISLLCVTPVFAQSPFGGPPQNPQDPGGPTNPGGYTGPGNSTTLDNPTNPGGATNPGASGTLDNPTNPGGATNPGSSATLDNPTNPGSGTDAGTGLDAGSNLNAGGGVGVVGPSVPQGTGLLPVGQNAGGATGAGNPNNPGYILYGGNGGQAQDFWSYLKGLFSLKGQDNQLTYKNQENPIIKYTEGTTPPELPKTLTSGVSTTLTCSKDTSNLTLNGYINLATCVILYLIPIIIAAMVLWFMFGAIKVMNDNEHETRNQYKQFLTWGVFILFVALCFVGILRLLSTTIGV